MLYLAEFGMHADKPGVFKQALQPHIDYLENMKGRVLLSPTKYPADGGKKALGFVWIIEAGDAAEARKICEDDPFWQVGLRTTFSLTRLTKALPDYVAQV